MSTEYGNCYTKQIVNDRSDWSDQAHNRAWQLMVEQLSPSYKTLTISYTTHYPEYTQGGQRQTLSHYFHSVCQQCVTILYAEKNQLQTLFCYTVFNFKGELKCTIRLSFEISAFGLNEPHTVKYTNSDGWIVKANLFFFFFLHLQNKTQEKYI